MPCPECNGRGWHVGECHPREECGACYGTGKERVQRTGPAVPVGQPPEPGHHVDCFAYLDESPCHPDCETDAQLRARLVERFG